MILYIIGILTGIVLCIFIATLNIKLEPTIERTIKQTQSKLKQKGSIIEPHVNDIEAWIEEIKI